MEKSSAFFIPALPASKADRIFATPSLQIGDDAPRSGDVEIDLRSNGWRAHGHDRNPNFQNVIACTSFGTKSARAQTKITPCFVVEQRVLDAPLGELSLSLENESLRSLPENLRGKCSAPLRELDERN
jgi:hypothetical protein